MCAEPQSRKVTLVGWKRKDWLSFLAVDQDGSELPLALTCEAHYKRDIFMSAGPALQRIMRARGDSDFYLFACPNFVASFRKSALNDERHADSGCRLQRPYRGSRDKVFV
jgi:hypothetical protein